VSDPTISLDWIGRTLRALQADYRTLRAEVDALRAEVAGLPAAVADVIRGSESRIMDRIAAAEARTDSRLDRLTAQLGKEIED
jgi:hypothetical protein